MHISYSKIRQMVKEFKEAQFGQYLDLEMLLEHLAEHNSQMDGEEAVLRFLYELSKGG
jgi:hypothetical protein